jgi:hypothetical protein
MHTEKIPVRITQTDQTMEVAVYDHAPITSPWCTQLAAKRLRSASCGRAVLGILMYLHVHSGFCAPSAPNLPSLATFFDKLFAKACTA